MLHQSASGGEEKREKNYFWKVENFHPSQDKEKILSRLKCIERFFVDCGAMA